MRSLFHTLTLFSLLPPTILAQSSSDSSSSTLLSATDSSTGSLPSTTNSLRRPTPIGVGTAPLITTSLTSSEEEAFTISVTYTYNIYRRASVTQSFTATRTLSTGAFSTQHSVTTVSDRAVVPTIFVQKTITTTQIVVTTANEELASSYFVTWTKSSMLSEPPASASTELRESMTPRPAPLFDVNVDDEYGWMTPTATRTSTRVFVEVSTSLRVTVLSRTMTEGASSTATQSAQGTGAAGVGKQVERGLVGLGALGAVMVWL